jgi:hypothetical protein
MADESLPAPKNKLVEIVNNFFDFLIKGLGADFAIAYMKLQVPWLNWPIVKDFFEAGVRYLDDQLNTSIKQNVDIVVIRFQDDAKRADYDTAIEEAKKSGVSNATKDSIDKLIRRNKP